MPRYENSPAAVSATIQVFPKDDYLFIVGEPKVFSGVTKAGKNAGKDNYGIGFSLTIKDGQFANKRTFTRCFESSEEAQGMSKQFKMAVLGYGKSRAEEERFNKEWGAKDWSFDTDSGAVGDAWREMTGKVVIGALDMKLDDNDNETQVFKAWRPLSAA